MQRRLETIDTGHGPDPPDFKEVIKLFERVVAENGAVIYDPSSEEEKVRTSTGW